MSTGFGYMHDLLAPIGFEIERSMYALPSFSPALDNAVDGFWWAWTRLQDHIDRIHHIVVLDEPF